MECVRLVAALQGFPLQLIPNDFTMHRPELNCPVVLPLSNKKPAGVNSGGLFRKTMLVNLWVLQVIEQVAVEKTKEHR